MSSMKLASGYLEIGRVGTRRKARVGRESL